jgi:small subunit ribosomal protein S1
VPFGAFVRVAAGIEGLVHISEISEQHIETPESVLSVGDEVRVKVIEVDVPRRRISLSMRQVGGAMPRPASEIEEEAAPAQAAEATTVSPSTAQLASTETEVAPAGITPDGGAESGATASAPAPIEAVEAEASSGDLSTDEAAPSVDGAVEEEPAATAAEATAGDGTTEEGEQSEEDISLEAILEDLKRREGRSG